MSFYFLACSGAEKIFCDPVRVEFLTENHLLVSGSFRGFYEEVFRRKHKKRLEDLRRSSFTRKYVLDMEYRGAVMDLVREYRAAICNGFRQEEGFTLYGPSGKKVPLVRDLSYRLLPSGYLFPSLPVKVSQFLVKHQRVLQSEKALVKGQYVLHGPFGIRHRFFLDPARERSGVYHVRTYSSSGNAERFAYGAFWSGTGKGIGLEKFNGEIFEAVHAETGQTAFRGKIRLYRNPKGVVRGIPLHSDPMLIFDLKGLRHEGKYFLRTARLGISEVFHVRRDAGYKQSLFYLNKLSGLRCHHCHINTARGAYPGEISAYKNGGTSQERKSGFFTSWGERVTFSLRSFLYSGEAEESVLIPGLYGGWHEDRSGRKVPAHLDGIQSMLSSLLWFPDKEGSEELLEEALYGLDLYKRVQEKNGGVGTRVEVSGHKEGELLLSSPERKSTLQYARSAALAALILRKSSRLVKSKEYQQSAVRAWHFAMENKLLPARSYRTVRKNQVLTLRYSEPVVPSGDLILESGYALYLLTGEERFLRVLDHHVLGIRSAIKRYGKTLCGRDFAVFLYGASSGAWLNGNLKKHYDFLRDQILYYGRRFLEGGFSGELKIFPADLLRHTELLAAAWYVSKDVSYYGKAWENALIFSGLNEGDRDLISFVPGRDLPDRNEEFYRIWGLYFASDSRRKKSGFQLQLFPGSAGKVREGLSKKAHRHQVERLIPFYYRSLVCMSFSGKHGEESLIARLGSAAGIFYILQEERSKKMQKK